jgi:hypothetical protein
MKIPSSPPTMINTAVTGTDVSGSIAVYETKVPGSADPSPPSVFFLCFFSVSFVLLFFFFLFLFVSSRCRSLCGVSLGWSSCSPKNMNDVEDAMIAVKPQPRILPRSDHSG